MKQIRIDMDLELNLHGRVEVCDWMMAERPEMVYDLLTEKLTREFQHAMRETIAKQMGSVTATPADLGEVRDLLDKAMRENPLDAHQYVGEAFMRLRRLLA